LKARVLIVDDSITVRMDLKEGLDEAGFETSLCATAASARDLCQRQPFDVIILGLLLSDMDGLEFLAELRMAEGTRETPVLLLSSPEGSSGKPLATGAGSEEYLGRAYQRSQVVARARYLSRRRLAEGFEKFLVLSIDDSPTFREALAEALKKTGYRVALAATGEEGLRLAAELRPHILLIDEQMPGMDGLEVQRRIRQDPGLRGLPCLFLTASQKPDSEQQALAAGADAYVAKTHSSSVILAKVATLLRPALPLAEMVTTPTAAAAHRILLVDDSPTYLAEAAEQLGQEGYDMVCAASGLEALDLLATEKVDAILMDLSMPGLSGEESCQRIKSQPAWCEIPLIVLTAQMEHEALQESINAGADDYVTKSVDLGVLKARLKAQLRRRRSEVENRDFREKLLRQDMEALEMRAVRELSESRATHIADLEAKNAELRRAQDETLALSGEIQSLSASVSQELRAPLRNIEALNLALLADHAKGLGQGGKLHVAKVSAAVLRMEQLIDGMLGLADAGSREMTLADVDLSALAQDLATELELQEGAVSRNFVIEPGLRLWADKGLLRLLMQNLIGNAWKFSSKQDAPKVEVFAKDGVFVVRNNGVDFANKPFGAFQRLHGPQDFEGSGVGLATAQRMVRRHGGRLWAEAQMGHGTSFHFSW
jgi:two-component system NtrC family sensor kinase